MASSRPDHLTLSAFPATGSPTEVFSRFAISRKHRCTCQNCSRFASRAIESEASQPKET